MTITLGSKKLFLFCYFVHILYPGLKDVCEYNYLAQHMFKEGGLYGLKDPSIIKYLLYIVRYSVVFGENKFPTVIKKVAHIWCELARYQAFNNGNKRTALVTTVMFLAMNHLLLDFADSNVNENLYNISVKIAQDSYDEKDVYKFLLDHVRVDLDGMQLFYNKFMK